MANHPLSAMLRGVAENYGVVAEWEYQRRVSRVALSVLLLSTAACRRPHPLLCAFGGSQ